MTVTEFSGASRVYKAFLDNIQKTKKCVACKRALADHELPVAEDYVRSSIFTFIVTDFIGSSGRLKT